MTETDVRTGWRWRVDWFAVLYVAVAFGIAALADHHGLSGSSMGLVADAAWVLGVPIGYAAAASTAGGGSKGRD